MLQPSFALTAMMTGFGLGAGAIFSIGPQNLKLIQAGALHRNPAVVAATGYLSEILIVIAGVSGVGTFLQIVPSVQTAMQTAGIAFVIWCAIKALRSAGSANRPEWARNGGETRGQAIVSMLVTTWLNPLVYIEIMLLVGVFSSSYDNSLRIWFALGFLGASGVRFCGLPAFGRVLAPWLQSPRAHASFNRLAGLLLLIVAASQAAAIL